MFQPIISRFEGNLPFGYTILNYFFFFFLERANLILRTCENPSLDLEAMEATSLAEILAKSSSGDVCHRELFLDDDLLVTTIGITYNFFKIVVRIIFFSPCQTYYGAYIVWVNQDQTILRLSMIILDRSNLIPP